VCQKECPDYKVSQSAVQTLTVLLKKDSELRPAASAALALPWLQTSKQEQSKRKVSSACLQPRLSGVDSGAGPTLLPGRSASATSIDGGKDLSADLVEAIPVPIRAKAGRAAARPPVDPNKEHSRTRALEAMKRRASVCNGLHSKLDGFNGPASPMSRSSSIADYLRSPVYQSRELTAEAPERRDRGGAGVAPSREILSLIENDAASDDSLSDSDGDDGMAVCTCR